MMKLMKFPLLALMGLAFVSPLSVSAAKSTLIADGDLLTEEEYFICGERLDLAAEETGLNIGLQFVATPLTDEMAADSAKVCYEAMFPAGSDGIFCCIDTTSEDGGFALYTSGSAGLYYLTDERESMIYNDLHLFLFPPETIDVSGAASMYAINLEYWHNEGPVEGIAVYDEVNQLYYYAENGEILTSAELPENTGDPEAETEQLTEEETDAPVTYTGDVLLYDESGRLSSEEYDFCMEALQSAAERTGMNVGMVIGSAKRSEYTIESLAVETYDQMFGNPSDGLLYYMDLSGVEHPYDYITTCGMGQFYYSDGDMDNRIDAIFDEVFPYLYPVGREDVVGAILEFASQVEYYYEAGIPDNYYVYDDVYNEYYYVEDGEMLSSMTVPYIDWGEVLMTGFFGLIFGLIVGLIVFFSVKAHYKFKVSLSPTAYVNRKNLVFHNQYDRFIRTYTTKTKIESSSGGGGSRGGGGRSSGGHGGGGRHR